jgi:hypothetical protein
MLSDDSFDVHFLYTLCLQLVYKMRGARSVFLLFGVLWCTTSFTPTYDFVDVRPRVAKKIRTLMVPSVGSLGAPYNISAFSVTCSSHYMEVSESHQPGCSPNPAVSSCDRVVVPNFLSQSSVYTLVSMAKRGMAKAPNRSQQRAGPTIMDVNGGFVLGSGEHQPVSIYRDGQIYSRQEYDSYRRVTTSIKDFIMLYFNLTHLHFTAPTFITREIGDGGVWKPATMHDEYWHVHADKNNTQHYDFSGLIYLSEFNKDFTGGELEFYDYDSLDCSPFVDAKNPGPCKILGVPDAKVHPSPGKLIVFGSGRENPHRVKPVIKGTRFVLSFWFTCDDRRKFRHFLDGQAHRAYDRSASKKNERTRQKKVKEDSTRVDL